MGMADLTQAQLARSMWDRYKTAYQPILQDLSSDLKSGRRLDESLAQVKGQTDQAFDLQTANQAAKMSRMGLSDEQSQTAMTQTDLAKAKSQASAENELRKYHEELKRSAVVGASGSTGAPSSLTGKPF